MKKFQVIILCLVLCFLNIAASAKNAQAKVYQHGQKVTFTGKLTTKKPWKGEWKYDANLKKRYVKQNYILKLNHTEYFESKKFKQNWVYVKVPSQAFFKKHKNKTVKITGKLSFGEDGPGLMAKGCYGEKGVWCSFK